MAQNRVRAAARAVAGPAMRRIRRELQWRGLDALGTAPASGWPHEVVGHATPLFRDLAGLDPELQRNKVVNLRLAAARLDGRVLGPGQRLSFWRQVGRPTYRRGFRDGLVLRQGRMTSSVGGGLCQLTNLIYWMTLHTPLTVVERWRHTYDVFPDAGRTQPFGSGATCAWPALDLQISNPTPTAFRLELEVTGGELRGTWCATEPVLSRYEVYEAEHVITNDVPGVFMRHNLIRRRTLNGSGEVLHDELVAANQALLMYSPFLESGR